jgi:serine carboxypeptidase 1
LTTLLIKIFNNDSTLQKCNLFIFGESYGGKFAATLGLSAYKAIKKGTLKTTLGGMYSFSLKVLIICYKE